MKNLYTFLKKFIMLSAGKVVSPLTLKPDGVKRLYGLFTSDIIKAWENKYGVSLESEYRDLDVIEYYECGTTKLRFFEPHSVAGSEKIYRRLQECDWYYMPKKWEYDMALKFIPPGASILEVGCGNGDFLEQALQKLGCDVTGIELNQDAAKAAGLKGVNVTQENAGSLVTLGSQFDVVCHFQVLEHVVNIHQFLADCVNCLKPGGLFMVGVPNMSSFLGYQNNMLNEPPHHMSQWYPESLRSLKIFFPLELRKILFEPLQKHHTSSFYKEWKKKPFDLLLSTKLAAGASMLLKGLAKSSLRSVLRGQCQLAIFQKR